MNEHTLNLVSKYVDKLTAAITKVSPAIWHTMLAVKQVDSIGLLAQNGIILVVAAIFAVVCWRLAFKCDWELPSFINLGSALGAVVSSVVGICACISMLDIWNWIGAFNPALAVAHDAIQKVLGN